MCPFKPPQEIGRKVVKVRKRIEASAIMFVMVDAVSFQPQTSKFKVKEEMLCRSSIAKSAVKRFGKSAGNC